LQLYSQEREYTPDSSHPKRQTLTAAILISNPRCLKMKRNREEIICDILGICLNGSNKTRIVYQANLNFKTVNSYLETLIKDGMISVAANRKKIYTTTDKGRETLSRGKETEEASG